MSGRFDINPGPLKVVPAEQRRHMQPDPNFGRCTAITKAGTRCIREGPYGSAGNDLCWQHSRQAGTEQESSQ